MLINMLVSCVCVLLMIKNKSWKYLYICIGWPKENIAIQYFFSGYVFIHHISLLWTAHCHFVDLPFCWFCHFVDIISFKWLGGMYIDYWNRNVKPHINATLAWEWFPQFNTKHWTSALIFKFFMFFSQRCQFVAVSLRKLVIHNLRFSLK